MGWTEGFLLVSFKVCPAGTRHSGPPHISLVQCRMFPIDVDDCLPVSRPTTGVGSSDDECSAFVGCSCRVARIAHGVRQVNGI